MTKTLLPLVFVIAGCFFFSGCLEDECLATRRYTIYTPVYAKMEESRSVVIQAESPRELRNPGSVFAHGDYLFISERHEGIHIVNNVDPANPVPVAFIPVPGSTNFAVRNNLLYTDDYIDLVAIDITRPESAHLVSRTENVFPAYTYREALGHVVRYEPSTETMELACHEVNFDNDVFWVESKGGFAVEESLAEAEQNTSEQVVGIAGSLARFTLVNGYLYALAEDEIYVFDLSNGASAALLTKVTAGRNVETIFSKDQSHLYLGAAEGMYIASLEDPIQPHLIALVPHRAACDPVYVEGNYAYISVRTGTFCGGNSPDNFVQIVDISNMAQPVGLRSIPMDNPHGLSIVNDQLFICEGTHGLKVFDATDRVEIYDKLLMSMKGFTAYDVLAVPQKDLLVLIAEDGIYQLNIANFGQPEILSILQRKFQ
ncbi:MAG: hypothetical protein R2824_18290 [Saprospiraceae bacterium]|nr:hypothetical protein [Lewinella sp.]